MRFLIGILLLVVALIFGAMAYDMFATCIKPWLSSPDTTHVTWFFAGFRFSGWGLWVPIALVSGLALAMAIYGLWILKRRP